MWYSLGKFILKNRLFALLFLVVATSLMGFYASKIKLSYDFTKAVPTDNPKFIDFRAFVKKFGADGNTMVIGVQSDKYFDKAFFNAVGALHQQLKAIDGVTGILSIPEVVTLGNDSVTGKLGPVKLFHYPYTDQADLDSAKLKFEGLPFYKTLLYNPNTHAYLMGISLHKDTINSKSRTRLINDILKVVGNFENKQQVEVYKSGMPFIRTVMANRIKDEMNKFLLASFLLSALTLFLFFRSISAVIMSLLVVGMGVIWSLGTIVLCGYEITLLTALIPILVVVIGIPNCIYFLNKYHTTYKEIPDKDMALVPW
jgi:predicted RND superfamily exporter protein